MHSYKGCFNELRELWVLSFPLSLYKGEVWACCRWGLLSAACGMIGERL